MINAMIILFLIYSVLQAVSLLVLRDIWKNAAILSAIVGIGIIGYTLFAYLMKSNLYPMLLLLSAPYLLGYIVFVLALGLWFKKFRQSSSS